MAGATLAKLGAIAEQRWGLVTTAQAEDAGVSRKQLSRMASTGALERVAQGVYRMAGAPELENQRIQATWLALGGAGPRTSDGVAPVVAAGITATLLHGIGDFFSDGFDCIVPARKTTRLPGVRLRVRPLARAEVIPVDGLPTLTVERTIADLLEQWTDLSLIADTVRDAVLQGKLVAPRDLVTYLDPIAAARHRGDGRSLAEELFELAGLGSTPGSRGLLPRSGTSSMSALPSPSSHGWSTLFWDRQQTTPLSGCPGAAGRHRSITGNQQCCDLVECLRSASGCRAIRQGW